MCTNIFCISTTLFIFKILKPTLVFSISFSLVLLSFFCDTEILVEIIFNLLETNICMQSHLGCNVKLQQLKTRSNVN